MKVCKEKIEAELAGNNRYFTGKKCKNGHTAERFTQTSYCVECDRERRLLKRMSAEQIAREVGLHHNGCWIVDEARFTKAIELARQRTAKPRITTDKGLGWIRNSTSSS